MGVAPNYGVAAVLDNKIMCSTLHGRITQAVAAELADVMDRAFATAPGFSMFHNWLDVNGYDSPARPLLTGIAAKYLSTLEHTHILAASQLVRVGLATANLVLKGHITVYSSFSEFQEAFTARLR